MARVYKMTDEAWNEGIDWDEAIYNGQIETVKEFDTLEEALEYWMNELGGDFDAYGVE